MGDVHLSPRLSPPEAQVGGKSLRQFLCQLFLIQLLLISFLHLLFKVSLREVGGDLLSVSLLTRHQWQVHPRRGDGPALGMIERRQSR